MKDTNAIQEELIKRSKRDIRLLVDDLMLLIREFQNKALESKNSSIFKASGLYWPVQCEDFWNINASSSKRVPNFSHRSYGEIANLLKNTLENNLLDTMVEGKTKELLKKIDLF
jgi:hypothetical protein